MSTPTTFTPTTSRPSVKDYASEQELLSALRGPSSDQDEPAAKKPRHDSDDDTSLNSSFVDWTLDRLDPETTEVNTLSEEYQRLQVLKSYFVLDEERDESLDRLTSMGCYMFNVPIAVISLVDMGRLWFLSRQGLGDLRCIPRKNALCAHAIMSKANMLIVENAAEDPRFFDNPLVVDGGIRFYAGTALMTPEGYRIGTYCVLDTKPRHDFSDKDQEMLKHYANLTVKTMVDRRYRMLTKERQERSIAHVAHDILTPLTGLQLSLSVLNEDVELKSRLDPHHQELVSTASHCTDAMSKICRTAIQSMREVVNPDQPPLPPSGSSNRQPVCNLAELVQCLLRILGSLPKKVPMIVAIEDSAPKEIVCDEIKVFRAALNFTSLACKRTEFGSVRLRIFSDGKNLTFECEDTAPAISESAVFDAFHADSACGLSDDSLMGLHYAASLVKSLDGTAGYRRREAVPEALKLLKPNNAGSVFWFTIPLVLPEGASLPSALTEKNKNEHLELTTVIEKALAVSAAPYVECLEASAQEPQCEPMIIPSRSDGSIAVSAKSTVRSLDKVRQKKALVVDDSLVVRKGIGRALSKLDYDVVLADDGMQGLKEMQKSMFDVVLMDFLMPNMDGLDCVKQYRDWEAKHRPGFSQHIVGISAHANSNDVEKGLKAGMNDFRCKPITIRVLTDIHESDAVIAMCQQLDAFLTTNGDAPSGPLACPIQPISPHFSSKQIKKESLRSVEQSKGSNQWCLVATARASDLPRSVVTLERMGWKCQLTHDSNETLELLKSRNWDAVLVDDTLRPDPGVACIAAFREWEKVNRVNRQNNVFLECLAGLECPSPSAPLCYVQAPAGFDGALNFPLRWQDFETLVTRRVASGDHPMSIIMR